MERRKQRNYYQVVERVFWVERIVWAALALLLMFGYLWIAPSIIGEERMEQRIEHVRPWQDDQEYDI